MKLIHLLFFLLPAYLFSQPTPDFLNLLEELNKDLEQYSKLSPFGIEYLPIDSFKLSEKEIEELLLDADYDATLSDNKDSVANYHMIYYFQDKILTSLDKIIEHPDFTKHNLKKLISSDELFIVRSDDGKLYNFSIDEKSGGTYRSRISVMHYTKFLKPDSLQLSQFQSFFASDGYGGIYSLNTKEGTKYVLTGNVRGCSYCFETFVQLVSFKGNEFHEEFMYSTNSRDWNNGVYYDPETKTIDVDYQFDDLTATCDCSKKQYGENDSYVLGNVFEYRCKCKYIFNGNNFECTEGRIERTYYSKEEFPEVLTFKITKNQKEVKLFTTPDSYLNYVFLEPEGLVEFSYPTDAVYENEFTISQSEDTLSFANGKTVYQIYEIRNQESLVDIGISVTVNGKEYNLKGDLNSLKGSLRELEIDKLNNIRRKYY